MQEDIHTFLEEIKKNHIEDYFLFARLYYKALSLLEKGELIKKIEANIDYKTLFLHEKLPQFFSIYFTYKEKDLFSKKEYHLLMEIIRGSYLMKTDFIVFLKRYPSYQLLDEDLKEYFYEKAKKFDEEFASKIISKIDSEKEIKEYIKVNNTCAGTKEKQEVMYRKMKNPTFFLEYLYKEHSEHLEDFQLKEEDHVFLCSNFLLEMLEKIDTKKLHLFFIERIVEFLDISIRLKQGNMYMGYYEDRIGKNRIKQFDGVKAYCLLQRYLTLLAKRTKTVKIKGLK